MKFIYIGLPLLLGIATQALSQPSRVPIASSDVLSQISMFSYDAGRKATLELRPTPIAMNAQGEAIVEYERGNARIEVKINDLPPPPRLGPYTTYVLWALTPDGRATSQGVVAGIEGGKGRLETQYPAPQFALIVTAEPHFAVTVPSTMIVLYNVGENVKGRETKVTSLAEGADYSNLPAVAVGRNHPADVIAAEYAVAAAEMAGAERYAPADYAHAKQKLDLAEAAANSKNRRDRNEAPTLAREAVLAGEDARREGMKGRAAAEAADAQAAAAANAAAVEAEAGARATAAAREAGERAAEAEREAGDRATEAAREAGERAAQAAALDAASQERAAQRQELLDRLNKALPTRETERGLVSEIGGVNFATGTADISVKARENLARFAGVVASYPDLKIKVEGHTDSTGSDQTNQALSVRRAIAVRDYLIGQHVPASSIDAEGFASSRPVDDNGTSEGRARNRRVEIVISGGLLTQLQSRSVQ